MASNQSKLKLVQHVATLLVIWLFLLNIQQYMLLQQCLKYICSYLFTASLIPVLPHDVGKDRKGLPGLRHEGEFHTVCRVRDPGYLASEVASPGVIALSRIPLTDVLQQHTRLGGVRMFQADPHPSTLNMAAASFSSSFTLLRNIARVVQVPPPLAPCCCLGNTWGRWGILGLGRHYPPVLGKSYNA